MNPFVHTFSKQKHTEKGTCGLNTHHEQKQLLDSMLASVPHRYGKLQSTGFRKIALAVYIHKTFEFRHIEPLWMYARRAKLGGELDWSFKLFEQNPDIFSDMMDKKKSALDISRESIQCVYQLLKSMTSTMSEWPKIRFNDNT